MFRSSRLLIRQARLGYRHFRRRQRVDLDAASNPSDALKSNLGRSLAFTVGTTTLFYTGATLTSYESTRARGRKWKFPARPHIRRQFLKVDDNQEKINKMAREEMAQRIMALRAALSRKLKHPKKASEPKKWFDDLAAAKWWKKQRPARKIFYGIVTANAVVFLMWQIPRFSNVMYKYFAHCPTQNNVLPMFLSVFSHKSAVHLGCNMIVLYSFIDVAVGFMGREQFLATYLSGGVISAFSSHLGKLYTQNRAVSFGASGAILTAIAYICMMFPDVQIPIILLPMVTFKVITGIKGMMAFNTVGLLSRWSFIDHAAHLGGALFGIGYYLGGYQLYFSYSTFLVQYWDRLRSGGRRDDK